MLKADKNYLRWIMKNRPERDNEGIALEIGCTLATVKKYRRAFQQENSDA
jgi:hypothetical protein